MSAKCHSGATSESHTNCPGQSAVGRARGHPQAWVSRARVLAFGAGQGQYLSPQAGGIQDSDPRPAAGPHSVLQAQQSADGPRPHSQAHRRALQVPRDCTWRDTENVVSEQLGSLGSLSPRIPRPGVEVPSPVRPVSIQPLAAVPICLQLPPHPPSPCPTLPHSAHTLSKHPLHTRRGAGC